MEPLFNILVPGIFGGLVLALLIAGKRLGTPPSCPGVLRLRRRR